MSQDNSIVTRRNVAADQAAVGNSKSAISEKSDIAPAVPASVIFKLLGFTLAMVAAPIGSYFMSVNLLFKGNSTYAGGLAAIIANVVLIAYVIVAWNDDQGERADAESKGKKSQ